MSANKIIVVGLQSQGALDRLGDSFNRIWPVQETSCFAGLLAAIDEADRGARRSCDEMPLIRLTQAS